MNADEHARLTELFCEAVTQPIVDQERLVARLRESEPTLADELASLLEIDRAAGGDAPSPAAGVLGNWASSEMPGQVLGASAATSPMSAAAVTRARSETGAPQIPGFSISGTLGSGGMGTVYAAEQLSPRRAVAIKVLTARSSAALARFMAEADIMARLDHPGIAKVYASGTAGAHPYFAMERVEGVTLDLYLEQARPERRARLEIFAEVCEAVHHAHVKGVIHRDLKPSNVMVRPGGRVTVLDFGIARVAHADGDGETRAGEVIGTPVYMSPEQARLRPELVDARSDVYALGVILFELLAERLPYDVRGRPLSEIARKICDVPPTLLGRVVPELGGDLEAIAGHALEKEPEHRYQSAAALGDDVRRYLGGRAVTVRTPGTLEQAVRFARRRPWLTVAVAGSTVLVIAVAVAFASLWLAARRAEQRAESASGETVRENDRLLLDRARGELAHDPTAALAITRQLAGHAVDARELDAIADLARGRGVASAVRHASSDELRWAEAAGDAVVTAGYDGRALRWRGDEPEVLWQAPGRLHVVRADRDARRFAIGGDGGAFRVVDAQGHVLAEAAGLAGVVRFAAWSHDGTSVVAGSDRGEVAWWRDGEGVRALPPASAGIRTIAFDEADHAILAGDDAGGVWRWDLTTRARTGAAVGKGRVVAVVGAAEHVVSLDQSGTLARWRVKDGALEHEGSDASGPGFKGGALAADGAFAIAGGEDGNVWRLDAAGVHALGREGGAVRAVAIAGDSVWAAAASDDGAIHAWNLATGRELELRGHGQRVRQLAFVAGTAALVSADSAGFARTWQLDAVPPTYLVGEGGPILQLAVDADATAAATVDDAGEVRRWDLRTGGAQRLGTVADRCLGVALAADAVVTASADGTIGWWRAGAEPRLQHVDNARTFAAARDGRWVAIGSAAGAIQVFDAAGEPRAALEAGGGATALAFSPDGSLLVAACRDRALRVWRTDALATPAVTPAPDTAHHLRFAPSGDVLVAAGDDGKVRAWTVAHGELASAPRVIGDHGAAIAALAFDRAGTGVLSIDRHRRFLHAALTGGRPAVPVGADFELAGTDALAVHDALVLGGTRGALHATAAAAARAVTVVGTSDGALAILRE